MNKIKENNFLQALVLSIILILGFSFCIRIYTVYLDDNIYHYNYSDGNYSIETDYNVLFNNELDNNIRKIIKNSKKNKDNLIVNNDVEKYKNFIFTHITIDINNNRKDKSYIYDSNNKHYKLEDFFSNKTSLNLFSKNYNTDIEHFYFNKKGLTLIYDNSKITIPWNELNPYLKKKYRNSKEKYPEIRDIEKYKGQKLLAFTFDDGPNTETTSILLDNLDYYDARVTFFVLGMRVDSNKEVLKRAYLMGNDIGSHTYSHKDLVSLKDKRILKEVNSTNEKIKNVTGVTPELIRPPYGSVNDHVRKLYNMKTICWNVDSLDWKLKNRDKIKKEIIKHAKDGNIILVHDIYKESVYGALLAMEELKKEGYNFVTISEMEYLKNVELTTDKTHFGF